MKTWQTPKGTVLPILNLRGKDYLQVAPRLVWFREEHPDWRIVTTIVHTSENESLVRAEIQDQNGNTIATAHKSENKQGFADHLEKSETGAIGRALALCGYGTQFCADELDEGARIVDSPIEPAQPKQEKSAGPADHMITFGKYKGKTIGEAVESDGLPAFEKYLHWIDDSASKAGKPISAEARFLKVAFERYAQQLRGA